MKIEYWIRQNKWIQVSSEIYYAFSGEKEIRPSTWRYLICQSLLQKYRYM